MNDEASSAVMEILAQAKKLARKYRRLTGRPLGITGEVAEFEAARLLKLQLLPARQAGYDALRTIGRRPERLQIKGRCVLPESSRSQRVGRIDVSKEFDAVLLVLMDDALDATGIYELPRKLVLAALTAPGSKARNERGALSVSTFKALGKQVWPVTTSVRP